MDELQDRIGRLERQNRRLWSCLLCLAVAGGVCLFAAAYQPEIPAVLQARQLAVVGDDGKVVWRAGSGAAGGYAEALRANGETKCWWSGAAPGDGGGMSMVWGGEQNEYRCVTSTFDQGAFMGCIHGADGKPRHQDGFTVRLDARRGIRVSLEHENAELWNIGANKPLRPIPIVNPDKR